MTWYAKPSGSYSYSSAEGTANILEMASILRGDGWSDEAITGAVANSIYEGGLNPWRWESDIYPPTGTNKGCGLFGFTPYARYLALPGSDEMNLSTSTVTAGASPNVGRQQVEIMADGTWGWKSSCWRTYWSSAQYPDLYTLSVNIRNQYGSSGKLSISQYANIDVIEYAVFAFLACFEGPDVPNYSARMSVAEEVYEIITGSPAPDQPDPPEYPPDPPLPDEPPPPTVTRPDGLPSGMPIYMMIRRIL